MKTFRVTDEDSGKTFDIQGESPPTQKEVEDLVASMPNEIQNTQAPTPQQPNNTQLRELSPPPASYTNSRLTERGNAAMSANPFMDPGLITNNAFEEATPPDISFDGLGKSTGGIAGGYQAANIAQKALAATPPVVRAVGTIAAGAGGAFTLGATGDLIESGAERYWGSENAPSSARDAVKQALQEGGKEAAFDAIGNTVFLGGGAALRSLKPEASKLAGKVSRIFEGSGVTPSIAQLTDNFLYTGLEKLVRGAFGGGGAFKKLDIVQDDAIVKYGEEYIKTLTDVASTKLTDTATGKLILDTVNGGRKAHSDAASLLYSKVDEISGGLTVNMSGLKKVARDRLDSLKRTGGIGETAEGGALLRKVDKDLPDTLRFEDAQITRSDLLQQQRLLSETKKDQAISRNISDMIDELDKAFDIPTGNEEAVKALKQANKFWRTGKKRFNNDLIKTMMKKEDTLSKIAPDVFKRGNKEEVRALRNAVRTTATIDKNIVFDEVWGKMQGSYLRSLLPTSTDDIIGAPIRKLHKDKALRKTLGASFTKAQQEGILDMSKAIDEILIKRGASGGLINLRQLGVAAQFTGAGYAAQDGINMGEATAIIGIPIIFSQISTRPALVKMFVRWTKAKPGTALKLTAVTKLASELGVPVSTIDPTNATGAEDQK